MNPFRQRESQELIIRYQTTQMVSRLVTSSIKLEQKNTTQIDELYHSKLKESDFSAKYIEKIDEILENYEGKMNISTDKDQILEDKIKTDLVDSRFGDGYIANSLLYAIFAIANFISPAIVKICGLKIIMVIILFGYASLRHTRVISTRPLTKALFDQCVT